MYPQIYPIRTERKAFEENKVIDPQLKLNWTDNIWDRDKTVFKGDSKSFGEKIKDMCIFTFN